MEASAEANTLLTVVGPKEINVRSGIKLEERWTDEEGDKRVEEINDFYAMGQSLTLNSVPEVVDCLTIRDYPDLYDYNGKKRLGAILVPDSYNPVKPNMVYVDPGELPNDKTKNDWKDAVGDMAERSVYEVLKPTFTHKKFKGSVLMIQGLNMLEIDPQKRHRKHDREMDFLIISKELSCVINIEVKNSLGKLQRKKVKQQLIENHQFFEDWFGADISSKWTWISMVYVEKPFPESCADLKRNPFIASGRQALKEKLLKIFSRPQVNTPTSEFKQICKYLLFCSPARPLPIGINQMKRMEEAIEKQGSQENIKAWCFPTPEQKAILNQSKVLFLAAWGTGKTLLMQSKAIDLANEGEKVMILIFQNEIYTKKRVASLLAIQLKLKMKSYSNIFVQPFWKEDILKLDKIAKEFKHVMIDEFFGDVPAILGKEQYISLIQFIRSKTTVWLSLSGNSGGAFIEEYTDVMIQKLNEAWFPQCNFTVASMKIPLRSPKKIIDLIKKFYIETGQKALNRYLLTNADSPPNLTEGKVTKFKMDMTWSMTECIKICLKSVPKGTSSMIIIQRQDQTYSKCDNCKDRIMAELFNSAFLQLGEKEPLHYTNQFRSPLKDIQDWMMTKGSDRHLIVSTNLALGFEHNIVINLSGVSSSSRSSGHLIIPSPVPRFPNLIYQALPISDYSEQNDHDCNYLFLAGLDTPMDVIGKSQSIHLLKPLLIEILLFSDRRLKKEGFKPVAVYNNFHSGGCHPMLLSALHFALKKSSLEEIMKPAAKHFLDIERESGSNSLCKLHPIFYQGNLLQNLMSVEVWTRIPMGNSSTSESVLMECLARCIESQIIWINVIGQKIWSAPFPYGAHFSPHKKLFVVRYLHAYSASFYITAEQL